MADEKKFEIAGPVSIVTTGKKSIKKEVFETIAENAANSVAVGDTGVGMTMAEIYDKYCKLIYVIDASGSMRDGMQPDDQTGQYIWEADLLKEVRKQMLLEADPDEDEEDEFDNDFDGEDEGDDEDFDPPHVASMTDEDIKKHVVANGVVDNRGNLFYGGKFTIKKNHSFIAKTRTKMQALKDAAKDFVHKRFQKYPDAKVILFQFEDTPRLLSTGGSEQSVLDGINQLPDYGGGGTNIYNAVHRAVEECRIRPSEVGSHHIVLVSDGLDGGATRVKDLVPKMKELAIVFDFIFMQGEEEADPWGEQKRVVEVLKGVCEATGGEFTIVKTEKDFVVKFLAASNRLMLPPGPK